MSAAIIRWSGPVSSLAGPRADGYGYSLPIPSAGAVSGLIGAAMGLTDPSGLHLDVAIVVHRGGAPFLDFQTADLSTPRMRSGQLAADGSIAERGGASDKGRAIQFRPLVAGFSATILAGPDGQGIDAAMRTPFFVPSLGRRDCMEWQPFAGGVHDLAPTEAAAAIARPGDTIWWPADVQGGRFGDDLIAIPERAGPPSWWVRTMQQEP